MKPICKILFTALCLATILCLTHCSNDAEGNGIELGKLTGNWQLVSSRVAATGRPNPIPLNSIIQFSNAGQYHSFTPNGNGTYTEIANAKFLFDTATDEIKIHYPSRSTWVWNVMRLKDSRLVLESSTRNQGVNSSEVIRNTYVRYHGTIAIGE